MTKKHEKVPRGQRVNQYIRVEEIIIVILERKGVKLYPKKIPNVGNVHKGSLPLNCINSL